MYIKSKWILKRSCKYFSWILPFALKLCSYYVQNYYSLKEIIPLEQVGEAGPPLEPNCRYTTAIIGKNGLSSGSAQLIAVSSIESKSHTQILCIPYHSN